MSEEQPDSSRTMVEHHTTGEDRVRMVARQLSEPRTANWIATEAGWSHAPTTRVLERLVDDGVLRRDESGSNTTYYPDYRRQAMQEAVRLRDGERSVEDLTDRLAEMNDRVRTWQDEFDVASPNELRATIGGENLDGEEETRRRELARDWDHLERRIRIVRFVIREWDFLEPGAAPATVGN